MDGATRARSAFDETVVFLSYFVDLRDDPCWLGLRVPTEIGVFRVTELKFPVSCSNRHHCGIVVVG